MVIKKGFSYAKDWITNHLGRNPRNGGRPPRDKRPENRIILKVGLNEEKNTCFR